MAAFARCSSPGSHNMWYLLLSVAFDKNNLLDWGSLLALSSGCHCSLRLSPCPQELRKTLSLSCSHWTRFLLVLLWWGLAALVGCAPMRHSRRLHFAAFLALTGHFQGYCHSWDCHLLSHCRQQRAFPVRSVLWRRWSEELECFFFFWFGLGSDCFGFLGRFQEFFFRNSMSSRSLSMTSRCSLSPAVTSVNAGENILRAHRSGPHRRPGFHEGGVQLG